MCRTKATTPQSDGLFLSKPKLLLGCLLLHVLMVVLVLLMLGSLLDYPSHSKYLGEPGVEGKN